MTRPRLITRALAGPLLAAGLVVGLPVGAPAQGACLSGAQARALVASGQVLPLSAVVAGLTRGGTRIEVVDAALCPRGGGHVYRLTVLGPGGRVGHMTVDARTGQTLGRRPF